ncbi:hypothetical protein J4402_01605 [Candidatus Pacearchaeota archaeon]|nr:hypothetical protein [Candidatus Pacearchaeota archaeon]
MKKVLYFGNPYIKEDSLAIKVAEKLKKEFLGIEFLYVQDTFQLIDMDLSNSILLDVVQSIKDVSLINQDNIISSRISTTHDFDLGFFLKLTNKKVKIIGIPQFYDEEKAVDKVKAILQNLSKTSPPSQPSKNASSMKSRDHTPV